MKAECHIDITDEDREDMKNDVKKALTEEFDDESATVVKPKKEAVNTVVESDTEDVKEIEDDEDDDDDDDVKPKRTGSDDDDEDSGEEEEEKPKTPEPVKPAPRRRMPKK
jgi:hypothetical protein